MRKSESERQDSVLLKFDDPDSFAAAIPGGKFGILPWQRGAFLARIRVTDLGGNVSIRGISISTGVSLRSEFNGPPGKIAFVLPSIDGSAAILDGREVNGLSMASRGSGDTPHLQTFGHNAGTLTIGIEALREASATFSGQEYAKLMTNPATVISADPRIEKLNRLHSEAGALLKPPPKGQLAASAAAISFSILREELLATLVDVLTGSKVRRDHIARRLQTASMARIEKYLDEHRDRAPQLQDLCRSSRMALRTVEAVIRSHTGMTALSYLRRRQLAFANQALRRPDNDTNVTAVAMRYGFFHLGRFSALYREIFGELPSATLAHNLGTSENRGILREVDSRRAPAHISLSSRRPQPIKATG